MSSQLVPAAPETFASTSARAGDRTDSVAIKRAVELPVQPIGKNRFPHEGGHNVRVADPQQVDGYIATRGTPSIETIRAAPGAPFGVAFAEEDRARRDMRLSIRHR